MTVGELREMLLDLNEDMNVFVYDIRTNELYDIISHMSVSDRVEINVEIAESSSLGNTYLPYV